MTITFLPSPNHAGRNGVVVTDIVLHWMDDTLAATDAIFANPASQVSAHYGIEDAVIHQYVQDSDVAWHSGDWNENQKSIGIEHSAAPGRDASPATIATSVALIVTLCREYGIDPSHIYPHNKFTTTECPGTLPLAAMIAAVHDALGRQTMRTMYDAVTPANIPANAQMVAGYVDGLYAWDPADWARFPNAVKVRIAVFPSTNDGVCLDCETGDATPAQCPSWVQMRRAAGVDPSVYCNTSTWPSVRAAFAAAGVAEPHYWVAAYPGNGANLYPGSVAHQYADPGPVDISVVADYWPGVDAAPTPPGPAPSGPPAFMFTISRSCRNPFLTRMVQTRLRSLGYVGGGADPVFVIDGDFGDQTATWVGLFQSRHGLTSDGIVGLLTWNALFA